MDGPARPLTSYWIITGLLLGFSQYLGLSEMYSSSQLSVNVGLWVQVVGLALPHRRPGSVAQDAADASPTAI